MRNARLWLGGGIAGMVSVICYILAITVNWPENQLGISSSLIIVSGFPILGIIATYALYSFIAAERESAANSLGLIFIITAFTTLLAMLFVQEAVVTSMPEIGRNLDAQTARALRRGLRMVDLGLDVAWDFLGGMWFVLVGLAMRKRSGLGPGWGIPSIVLGIALIVLNAATFPIPPANHGLIDIGPFCGLFMLFLSARLAFLGKRELPAMAAAVAPA